MWTPEESEALRKWMGGELPPVRPEATQGGRMATGKVVKAIREAQRAAAEMREAWRGTAEKEVAKRQAMSGGAEGRAWKAVGFEMLRAIGRADKVEAWQAEHWAVPGASERAVQEAVARHRANGGRATVRELGPTGWTVVRAMAEYQRWKLRRQEDKRDGTAPGDPVTGAARDDGTVRARRTVDAIRWHRPQGVCCSEDGRGKRTDCTSGYA